ncbi:alpha/beta-hydrolase [Lentithecium fluviatile CBS 122367]|uniref:Alpha/beta-hydrolase n=1 Tax=Lentithecium fluviatile CBS 122367 TaxID=1168545 RepID=A0A6G1IN38_9PLEO|nr:alpha/beta-hydrolase [Lentithecium fluviatile CBS 122367]
MAASKVAFLFVPGSWCPGYYFHKVSSKLEAQGYTAISVNLPSVGRKDLIPGLEDDAAHVRSEATAFLDAGKDVVIVGNSYGGFVTLEACKGLPRKLDDASKEGSGILKHIVTINSPLAQKGQSMQDLVGDQAPIPKDSTDPWIEPVPGELGYRVLFGSLNEEEGMKYAGMVQAQCIKPLLEPLTFVGYEEVGCTAVISGKDLAFKKEKQFELFEKAAQRAKAMRKVVLEEGDHVPMLGFPDDIVRVCLEVAAL